MISPKDLRLNMGITGGEKCISNMTSAARKHWLIFRPAKGGGGDHLVRCNEMRIRM